MRHWSSLNVTPKVEPRRAIVPWVLRREDGRLQFVCGLDRLLLSTEAPLRGQDFQTFSEFAFRNGEEISFSLNWSRSYGPPPPPIEAIEALESARSLWSRWAARFTPPQEWGDVVDHHRMGDGKTIAGLFHDVRRSAFNR
jgi:hypothetical protein